MLKSLELFGFKSFADRTLFEFAAGITCVVGPNGSGKSNVVDAIKWILGDQSAKSLRGQDMSDVIFNGAAGRKASGFAEATLTFDNTQRLLPIDVTDVQIGRRLYASGDSEYLLNGAAVRLKDVRNLLLGTGAGAAAYSIIEQGRVDQILQANPTTRRIVFEEAAGISKFKQKRIEAERRLERVAQNLLRLNDLVEQAETQLNSARSQAGKAAKHRELSTELRAAWIGLAADDYRELSTRLHELQTARGDVSARQEIASAEIDTVTAARTEAEQRLSVLEDSLLRQEREIASIRESIASRASAIRHQTARGQEQEHELRRLRRQRFGIARQFDLIQAELARTAEQIVCFTQDLEHAKQEVAQRQASLQELENLAQERRSQLERQRKHVSQVQQQRHQIAARLAATTSQLDSLSANQNQTFARLEKLDAQLEAAYAEQAERQAELEAAEEAVVARQAELTETQSAHSKLFRQRDEAEGQLREMRERRSAAEARLSALDELEQRQEGIAVGVQEILKRAETSHYPPWNRVLGVVRDLIDVPLDLAPIVDAALGERAQLIAIADLGPLLDYLDRGDPPIDGRVGFVSLQRHAAQTEGISTFEIDPDDGQDLTGEPGVYGRADRLVVERDATKGLAKRVLGDTWIVETLAVAREMASRSECPMRFVTLQGEVLCSDHRLFVGAVPHDASIISRKSELRQLKNEIHQLHRSIEATTQRIAILAETLESHSSDALSLDEELKRLASHRTVCATRLGSQSKEIDRLERERSEVQKTLEALDEQQEKLKTQSADLEQQIEAGDLECQEATSLLRIDEDQISGVEDLLKRTQQELNAEQLVLARSDQQLTSLQEAQTRLAREQRQRQQQLLETVHRAGELRESRRKGTFEILAAESQTAELFLQLETRLGAARECQAERDQIRARCLAFARNLEGHHQQRRELADELHAIQIEIQKQELRCTALTERIREEFQLSLEEASASGASAYRDFLTEQYGAETANEIEGGSPRATDEESDGDSEDLTQSVLVPSFAEVRDELEARVDRLQRKLKAIGSVNSEALDNLESLEQRFTVLSGQLNDLDQAKAALEEIIQRINHESQRIFLETFETIRVHFQELFRKLFGGGDANIILEDPNDVLECGIEIVARPPGKELRSISLLSGGEKTMTAVGLLFAMFKSKPSPYCVLDEVDAALDEANVDRYVSVLREFVSMTQFIVITHRKPTMTAADVIYGVTMEQAGVSKRISVRFEDVRENGEIRSAA